MAEYLIQDTTLDAIANAINAKTGSSSAMTPAQMVTAIRSISGGGGNTLICDYTAAEDVATIRCDVPQKYQSYRFFVIELIGQTSSLEWLYIAINEVATTSSKYYPQKLTYNEKLVTTRDGYSGNLYLPVGGANLPLTATFPVQFFSFRLYSAESTFKAGFNIKIWGI